MYGLNSRSKLTARRSPCPFRLQGVLLKSPSSHNFLDRVQKKSPSLPTVTKVANFCIIIFRCSNGVAASNLIFPPPPAEFMTQNIYIHLSSRILLYGGPTLRKFLFPPYVPPRGANSKRTFLAPGLSANDIPLYPIGIQVHVHRFGKNISFFQVN
jgi:hypothetical protein